MGYDLIRSYVWMTLFWSVYVLVFSFSYVLFLFNFIQ